MKPTLATVLLLLLAACGKSEPPGSDAPPVVPAPAAVKPAHTASAAQPAQVTPPVASAPITETHAAPPLLTPTAKVTAPAPAPRVATPPAATSLAPPAVPIAPPVSDPNAGRQTYQQACAFCHDKGVAGAPRFGDAAAWSARTAQGMDALHASALQGKGAMPAKGGNPSLSDTAVRSAVDYLVAGSR